MTEDVPSTWEKVVDKKDLYRPEWNELRTVRYRNLEHEESLVEIKETSSTNPMAIDRGTAGKIKVQYDDKGSTFYGEVEYFDEWEDAIDYAREVMNDNEMGLQGQVAI